MHAVSRALFSSWCNLIFISYISLSIFDMMVVVVNVLLAWLVMRRLVCGVIFLRMAEVGKSFVECY